MILSEKWQKKKMQTHLRNFRDQPQNFHDFIYNILDGFAKGKFSRF